MSAPAFEPYDRGTGEVLPAEAARPLLDGWSGTGLRLRPGLTFAEYEQAGWTIRSVAQSLQWVWVDWLAYGEEHFPDTYPQVADAVGVTVKTLQNLMSVGRAFPPSRRRDDVPFALHEVVAGLPDRDEQDELLEQAAERIRQGDRVGRNELRAEVQRRKLERGVALDVTAAAAAWADEGRRILGLLGRGATIARRDFGDLDDLTVLVQTMGQVAEMAP